MVQLSLQTGSVGLNGILDEIHLSNKVVISDGRQIHQLWSREILVREFDNSETNFDLDHHHLIQFP
jgi:hypothetical protein